MTCALTLRIATPADAEALLGVYAPYVPTAVTFEEETPSVEEFRERVVRALEHHPYLVACQGERVVGYAYAHPLFERDSYRWNAELSIYLAAGAGRKGLGSVLYQALLDLLKLEGICKAYGRLVLPNVASRRLHEKLGFKQVWVHKKGGWKAGKWRDVAWYCKQLNPQGAEMPADPVPFPQLEPAAVEAVLERANAQLRKMAEKPVVSRTTRKSMQGNIGANTKPELLVRKMLRDMGYPGYRLQWKAAPGRPDIAYPGRKLAIFVNGCFWHRCPVCNLPLPSSNVDYWEPKFKRNVERDQEHVAALEAAGWTVVTIWEHDLTPEKQASTSQYLYEVISLTD
ncbi:MAG: DNA mismatch endonuclease Vsr [Coriobacteriia bacterium]|nr:DNA mismatch endonuclease Vsr [Coriobacteriia bacterium]